MTLTHGHSKKSFESHTPDMLLMDYSSFLIKTRRLSFFGHVACLDPRQDRHRAIIRR